MAYDLKITNGTVYDGNGGAGQRADIGIRDGKIVDVGDCPDAADRTIDAEGAIVTPGFVDLHTHYDGQISWDDEIAPSIQHGVTTAVMGNCGVGFAPVRASDRERLIRLMEGVEDIPGTALHEGISWDWETFPEYMEAIDTRPHTLDYALQVPHDALRVYAMGERAFSGSVATDDDIATMRDLVGEALDAGAAGFSTGRTDIHRTADGEWTPASEAATAELAGIAEAFKGRTAGVLQGVSDFDLEREGDRFDEEFDVLEAMAKAGGGRPMSISTMQRDMAPKQWEQIIARAEQANAKGIDIKLQVAPRGIGVLMGLEATFHPFMGFPSYKAIAGKSLEERVAIMRDPSFRARILAEKSDKLSGEGSSIPPLADVLMSQIDFVSLKLFRLGENPDYEQPIDQSLYARGRAKDQSPLEAIYDTLLEEDGRALLYFPVYNYTKFNYENVLTMLRHPLALPGLSDGGAHVGFICDASFPTYLMSYWTRDRTAGEQIPLERAIQMMTADGADHMGFADRGRIAPGLKADLNIIDHAHLGLKPPRLVHDLPAGGARLLQDAKGYRATVIAGEVVVENDAVTDARPGRLVRLGQ